MYEHVSKKKENKSRTVSNYVPQRKSCSKEGFDFYKRPETKQSIQLKSNKDNFSNNMPIQMVVFIKSKDGKTRMEEDDFYDLQDDEEYDYEALEEYEERIREEKKAIARQKRAEEEELKAQEAAKKRQQILERERQLSGIPLIVTRRDKDFRNPQNRRGQGKAHITEHGLAPAGRIAVTAEEQLDQTSINKGESDRISFTGPKQNDGVIYGDQEIEVKLRKIARAKIKGKKDAQHLEVFTSKMLLDRVRDDRLRGYVRRDDEHQVRVAQPEKGELLTIPARFIRGSGFMEQHDSDSEDEL
ncbi:hypothetical protein EHE19_014345 [Ruminiclostridium herbifermentans]|uniref:Uncharacterized protein n=1 Tax=Ruminiclostridium herbifermentans TaxID=2488810 RepID=A0A4U7JJ66_9FIRM|nr:hypothetical protein [Ruminiclostridium herbifermentans]QNU66053.1 hypothetical protein EHE19_014345 [Ruminiclostridium herbifermentans]